VPAVGHRAPPAPQSTSLPSWSPCKPPFHKGQMHANHGATARTRTYSGQPGRPFGSPCQTPRTIPRWPRTTQVSTIRPAGAPRSWLRRSSRGFQLPISTTHICSNIGTAVTASTHDDDDEIGGMQEKYEVRRCRELSPKRRKLAPVAKTRRRTQRSWLAKCPTTRQARYRRWRRMPQLQPV
jgi:hypothetical protein